VFADRVTKAATDDLKGKPAGITSLRTESTLKEYKPSCFSELPSNEESLSEKSLAVYQLLKQKDERIEALAKELMSLKQDSMKTQAKLTEQTEEVGRCKALIDFCSQQLGILEEEALDCTVLKAPQSLFDIAKAEEIMLSVYQLDEWKAKAECTECDLKRMQLEVQRLTDELTDRNRTSRVVEDLLGKVQDLKLQLEQKDCELQLLVTENHRLSTAYEREASANKSHIALIRRLNDKLGDCRRILIASQKGVREEQLQQLIQTLEQALDLEESLNTEQLHKFMEAMSSVAAENRALREELNALRQ
jgi:hypothetical protein